MMMAGDEPDKGSVRAKWRDWTLITVVVVLFSLFGYAIWLANSASTEEVQIVEEVRAVVERQEELQRQNQQLVEFVARELDRHRCEAAITRDALLQAHGVRSGSATDVCGRLR